MIRVLALAWIWLRLLLVLPCLLALACLDVHRYPKVRR
jgi:hypothetical protein